MGRCKRYTKDELLKILNEKCPDAVAKLPSPDAFEFKRYNDRRHMLIGSTNQRVRRGELPLWVQCLGEGETKPWLAFETDFTTDTSMLVRREGLKGNFFFGKMTKSGLFRTLVDSDSLKAVVAFVFVYCGNMEKFMDFGFGRGVKVLVESLQAIAARTQDEGEARDSPAGEDRHAAKTEKTAKKGHNSETKRPLTDEGEDEGNVATKKTRVV
jgi:hypothetical protein